MSPRCRQESASETCIPAKGIRGLFASDGAAVALWPGTLSPSFLHFLLDRIGADLFTTFSVTCPGEQLLRE